MCVDLALLASRTAGHVVVYEMDQSWPKIITLDAVQRPLFPWVPRQFVGRSADLPSDTDIIREPKSFVDKQQSFSGLHLLGYQDPIVRSF